MTGRKILLIAGALFLVLTCLRVLWISSYTISEHPHAVHGELDLRDREFGDDQAITLDGEWSFQPEGEAPRYIEVPGSWDSVWRQEDGSSYGYAVYRLRILVDPEQTTSYGLFISSVRSSSELFVNDRLLAYSGKPLPSETDYTPYNVPVTAYFTADEHGVIEIVIHAANYDDPRGSGIVGSIKFGSENAIRHDLQMSLNWQLVVCVALLLHAVYAFLMYLTGIRDQRLMYFSIMAVCIVAVILMLGDKVLLQMFPMNIEWSLKLMGILLVAVGYCIMQCIKPMLPEFWRAKVFPWYTGICATIVAATVLLPLHKISLFDSVYLLILVVSWLTALTVLLRAFKRKMTNNIYILLTVVAVLNHIGWTAVLNATAVRTFFYPFDLLAATIAFAFIWLTRYFHTYNETKLLAAKLQEADKRKDEFLANTSHELRNPLHGMLNISQTVLERESRSLRSQSVKDLELLLTVGRRMSFMLNDLLDASRLKESRIQLHTREVSIQTVVAGVLDMLRFMTEGKPITMIARIPEHFPPVIADENRLIQILFNLIHNAIKYTREGEISVTAYGRSGKAFIAVEDSGIGMNEEMLSRVFEPYEQAHPEMAEASGGFGLGLGICKQLVELHGGRLKASSAPGRGSVFTFTLTLADRRIRPEQRDRPSQEHSADSVAAADSESAASAAAQDSGNLAAAGLPAASADEIVRIMAVDDDPVNLKVLENIFSVEPGYEVHSVGSGMKALSMLNRHNWDLIIADVMMPGLSGYELTRKIRERFSVSDLPVLLLTARNQPEDIETGFLSGANDYVAKPVSASELKARVRALTGLKRSIHERLRMEAAWLQAQIKPHFILNTFNVVAALSKIDTNHMNELVEAFSNYLRMSFDFQNSEQSAPLEHELELIRSYLYIEQQRFGDRLQVVWNIDEHIRLDIPPLSIQPLVENAVRHGILKRTRGGQVRIAIADREDHIEVSIADDGIGMDEEALRRLQERRPSRGEGIGLLNTDRRLRQAYGAGLKINSEPGRGTTVAFSIPKRL